MTQTLIQTAPAGGTATPDAYGRLIEPATLEIQRLLPGPIERVWSYLTDADKRRQWLAGGLMQEAAGTEFEFVWRNDELTDPPGAKPDGFGAEHRMKATITEYDPPRRLAFTWDESGDVSIALEPRGKKVLLTLVHRRLPRRSMLVGVSSGWHAHLDVLAARLEDRRPTPFWDAWAGLKADYERRIPE
ncbi:uncharacterized protein YndB with AHSA1/START domain [Amorphus suaedae]